MRRNLVMLLGVVIVQLLTVAPGTLSAENFATITRKAPYLIYAGDNTEMQVLWQLDSTAICTIEWGVDTLYNLGHADVSEYGSDHQFSYTISGLTPGRRYAYRVRVNAASYTGSFLTAPDTSATRLKFFAYGDTRSHPDKHDLVAKAMVAAYTGDADCQSFVLSVGDLVNNGVSESDWEHQFFDPSYRNIQTMLANLPYQSAMGNHEGTGVLFVKYFPYPYVGGRYWSFDYGPAHFVMVDQYSNYTPGSAQLSWIESDLASTSKLWKFICLHEPGWSAAGGHDNNRAVQQFIQPLCEKYGVSIVFAGHNHYYSRAEVNGVQHITTGGGGAPLHYPETNRPHVVITRRVYHFCEIEIDGAVLHFSAINTAGNVVDSFTIDRGVLAVDRKAGQTVLHDFNLYPAYPNPFNPATTLRYELSQKAAVVLTIYNLLGQKIVTLVDATEPRGEKSVVWDGRDGFGRQVSSGIYVYRLQAGDDVLSRKMLLLK